MPWIAPRPAYPSKLLIRSILLKAIRARRMVFERILAHRISCQRAISLLSSRKATKQPDEYRKRAPKCQPRITDFLLVFHSLPSEPASGASPKRRAGGLRLPPCFISPRVR